MLGYSVRIAYNPNDECFVAEVPEFEGVNAFGSSKAEALQELEVALELTVEAYGDEGRDLPVISEYHEYSGKIQLRLPKSIHARAARQAEVDGISLNSLLISMISEGLGERNTLTKVRTVVRETFRDVLTVSTLRRPNPSASTWSSVTQGQSRLSYGVASH